MSQKSRYRKENPDYLCHSLIKWTDFFSVNEEMFTVDIHQNNFEKYCFGLLLFSCMKIGILDEL